MRPLIRQRPAALLAAALIAVPCSRDRELHAQAPATPRFDALVSLTEAKMKEYGVPGVALGIIDGNTLTTRGLGITNVEDSLPVTAHTVFPIASISKTFAATAMMRLVEQGKVDLRAPVRTYLPDFRVRDDAVSRDVTVWHLLTHLGGWEGQVSGPERGTATLENFVATALPDLMQVAPAGKAWSYNNAGFSIAGRVIEVATGTSINRAMRDLVFQPLGLEHAGTTAGDFIVNRFAAGHSTRDGKTTLQRPFTPSSSVTAGGVGLCITDLLAYARFHMGDGTAANGERVLTRASLELMRTAQAAKQSTDDSIGLAWHMRHVGPVRTFSHGGTLGGHILLLELVPERNFAIAILTNANTGWRLIQDVEREALESYLGATYAPNQAIAHRGLVETLPAVQPLARQPDPAPYLGTYARPNNSYVVSAEGGKLVVQDRANRGGTPREYPVAFYGPDRVVVTDGPDRGQSIEFVRDDSGRVNWVRVVGRVAVRTP
jgi:CubicO group peptidase (beta-lactamase class C family)